MYIMHIINYKYFGCIKLKSRLYTTVLRNLCLSDVNLTWFPAIPVNTTPQLYVKLSSVARKATYWGATWVMLRMSVFSHIIVLERQTKEAFRRLFLLIYSCRCSWLSAVISLKTIDWSCVSVWQRNPLWFPLGSEYLNQLLFASQKGITKMYLTFKMFANILHGLFNGLMTRLRCGFE